MSKKVAVATEKVTYVEKRFEALLRRIDRDLERNRVEHEKLLERREALAALIG